MRWFGPREEHKAVVSVKGGKTVNVEMVRSLDSVVTKQGAQVGVLLSLEKPTKDAYDWAKTGSVFEVEGFQPVPRLQIVTVEEALSLRERAVRLPALPATVKAAPREEAKDRQSSLDL